MATNRDQKKWWQFSIRDLLVWGLLIGVICGWYVDHSRLSQRIATNQATLDEWSERMLRVRWMASSNPQPSAAALLGVLDIEVSRLYTRDWHEAIDVGGESTARSR